MIGQFRSNLKELEGEHVLEAKFFKENESFPSAIIVEAWCQICHMHVYHGLPKNIKNGHMESRGAHCRCEKGYYIVMRNYKKDQQC